MRKLQMIPESYRKRAGGCRDPRLLCTSQPVEWWQRTAPKEGMSGSVNVSCLTKVSIW